MRVARGQVCGCQLDDLCLFTVDNKNAQNSLNMTFAEFENDDSILDFSVPFSVCAKTGRCHGITLFRECQTWHQSCLRRSVRICLTALFNQRRRPPPGGSGSAPRDRLPNFFAIITFGDGVLSMWPGTAAVLGAGRGCVSAGGAAAGVDVELDARLGEIWDKDDLADAQEGNAGRLALAAGQSTEFGKGREGEKRITAACVEAVVMRQRHTQI
jgi:hypothetical protein